MKNRLIIIGGAVVLSIAILIALWVLRPPAEASEPIEAIPLQIETSETADPTTPPTEPTAAPEPTAETMVESTTAEPVAEPATAEPATATSETAETSSPILFEIGQDGSEVRFELDEDLRGVRTTVVGTTNQVAGQIAFNPADLSTTQIGIIQVNARTLATDNDFRNRAIRNEILDTGSYEFITFTPTAVEGLPANVAMGQEVTFTIVGDLTIRDITHPVTFQVTATMVSETELRGTASTTVLRGDYDLNIPNVPQVANVEEEVDLIIEFIATRI